MLILISVFWMLLAYGPVVYMDEGNDGTRLREAQTSSPVRMTGKPIKIPPKKVVG